MGCGLVDPAVLEGMNLDPERWSGFAAGIYITTIKLFKMFNKQNNTVK